jgi:long-chain acyl-CoA synthetase
VFHLAGMHAAADLQAQSAYAVAYGLGAGDRPRPGYRTGHRAVAARDDEGHYFIVDRRKDLIITGGFNVYPAEIERVVASHPAVAMVAVGSVPDETLGELARAYVVLRPGATATETEIIEHCRPHLAAYKRPRSVRFVPDLPKTSTGKVMRRELKTLDR